MGGLRRQYASALGSGGCLLPVLLLYGLPVYEAMACTTCRTPLAGEVRLWVLRNFWMDLAGVMACVPFLMAAVLLAGRENRSPPR